MTSLFKPKPSNYLKASVQFLALAVFSITFTAQMANASSTETQEENRSSFSFQSSRQDIQLQLDKYQIGTAQIKQFYAQHPALFSERYLYTLQELTVQGTDQQIAQVLSYYQGVNTLGELSDWLIQQNIVHKPSIVNLAAENIPADILSTIASMEPNQVIEIKNDNSLSFIQMVNKVAQPKSLTQASSVIKLHLLNTAMNQ
ncbi:peptidyl-prolyl cis-trans isomerase [Thalassotalea sp. PLHSN55]|uniref:peptidyl-prolyl cis-trans isomerase n=1 Tax=Thalassotalea sp. PLHSN55 TaxID=3435888 RepID=UPI003F84BE51